MVIQFIIQIFFGLLSFLLSLIQLPGLPANIANAFTAVFDYFLVPLGLIRNLLGDAFLSSLTVAMVAYYTAMPIFHIAVWIYQRIRG